MVDAPPLAAGLLIRSCRCLLHNPNAIKATSGTPGFYLQGDPGSVFRDGKHRRLLQPTAKRGGFFKDDLLGKAKTGGAGALKTHLTLPFGRAFAHAGLEFVKHTHIKQIGRE